MLLEQIECLRAKLKPIMGIVAEGTSVTKNGTAV